MAGTEQRKIEIIANGSQVNATFKEMAASSRLLENQLKKLPPGTQEFVNKSKQLQDVKGRMSDVRKEMYGTQSALSKLSAAFGPMLAAFGAAAIVQKVGQFFTSSSAAAKEFEKSLSNLSSITGATGKDLQFYEEQAKLIGQTTTLSASQAVEAFKLIGSAKPDLLASKEALVAVTQEAVALGEAAGIDLPTAAAALTTTLNQFDLAASESSRVINVLAAGSKFGAGDINYLNDAISRFGPSASAMNISIEQSAAAMEVLAEKGIQSEKAGTSFRNVLVELANSSDELNPEIVGLDMALENLGKQGLSTSEISAKFGKENLAVAQILSGSSDRFKELKESITGTEVAYEQAAINTNNLDGDLKGMDSAIESLMIGFGQFLNAALRPLVQGFTGFVLAIKAVPEFVRENKETIIELGLAILSLNAGNILAASSTLAMTVAEKARAIATKSSAVAQRLLNATMNANPIGLLIKTIGLLVTGFVLLYNRSEAVRNGVAGIWEALKSLASSAADIFIAFMRGDFSALADAFSNIGKNTSDAYSKGFEENAEKEGAKIAAAELKRQQDLADRKIELKTSEIAKENALLRKRLQVVAKDSEEEKKIYADLEANKIELAEINEAKAEMLEGRRKARVQAEIDSINEKLKSVEAGSETELDLKIELNKKLAELNVTVVKEEKEVDEDVIKNKEEANAKKLAAQQKHKEEMDKLRETFEKAEADAAKSLEDLKIALMAEGEEKRMAQAQLTFDREMEELEAKKQAVLDNVAVTEEEKNALLAVYEEERLLKEEEKALLDEEIRLESREERIDKELEELEEEEAIKSELLEQQLMNTVATEAEVERIRLDMQKKFLQDKLKLLQDAGKGETLEAQKLKTALMAIDVEKKNFELENARLLQEGKRALRESEYATLQEFSGLAMVLFGENKKAQQALLVLEGAMAIGNIIAKTQAEIAGYYAAYSAIPGGVIVATGLAATAKIRAGIGIATVAAKTAKKFEKGGMDGESINMMYNGGSWKQPNGQSAGWAGSFARGGHIGSASLGLIGEKGREWVSPNWMVESPKYANILSYLESERVRGRAFADGGSTGRNAIIPATTASPISDIRTDNGQEREMVTSFNEMKQLLMSIDIKIAEWPTRLRVINDPRDTSDALQVINEIEADSRITR